MLNLLRRNRPAIDDGSAPTPDEDPRYLRKEARQYANLMSHKLEQLDICFRYRKSEKDLLERAVQRVKFNLAVTHRDALWLRIDTGPRAFPRGVSLAQINDPAVLDDLSVTCERPIQYKKTPEGAWLVIARDVGIFGIKRINYDAVEEHYPVKSLKALNVPLGLTYNNKIVYRSLAEFPHALVGGATGSGKTTFLHAWICSLVTHTLPDDLQLVLIDLKGGTEFTRYQTLPHVMESGFVKDEDDVVPMLLTLETEMRRRLQEFEKRGGVQNIGQWNVRASTSARYERLPRIAVFVDELSAVMLRPNLRKHAIRLFTTIGERGRAPGIHLVLATQRPVVRVVDGQIKGNLEARFAFRVTDDTSSMVILDSVEAARMPESTPRGRYIYRSGLDRMELQAPLITPLQIKEILRNVMKGDAAGAAEASRVAPEDVFRMALSIGTFAIHPLYKAMDGRASRIFIERLAQEYENEIVELDGITYQLLPPEGDFKPRRLVPTAELIAMGYHLGGDDEKTAWEGDGGIVQESQPESQNALALPAPESQTESQEEKFNVMDWLTWARENCAGQLSIRKIQKQFNIRLETITQALAEIEGQQVEVLDKQYIVKPGVGNLPRRLIKVEEDEHGNL